MDGDKHWQFWIDRGGTFTDIVALRPDGELETAKLLSENPEQYDDAAAEGVRQAIGRWSSDGGDKAPIHAVKMGGRGRQSANSCRQNGHNGCDERTA
jgi:5-oxoprolinase (ATP-hydrolysing)